MAEDKPILRGRRWFWGSMYTVTVAAILVLLGEDIGSFAIVAGAALGVGNFTTVAGRMNYNGSRGRDNAALRRE